MKHAPSANEIGYAPELLTALEALHSGSQQFPDIRLLALSALETLLDFSGFDCGAIYFPQESYAAVAPAAIASREGNTTCAIDAAMYGPGSLIQQVVQKMRAFYVKEMNQASYASRACLPLVAGGILQGVLDLLSYHPYTPAPEKCRALEVLADEVGTLLAVCNLHEQAESSSKRLIRLNEYSGQILESETYQDAISLTVKHALEITQANSASIYLLNYGGGLSLSYGLDNQGLPLSSQLEFRPGVMIREVQLSGKPRVMGGFEAEDERLADSALRANGISREARAYIAVPLKRGNRSPVGVLLVAYDSPRLFTQLDIDALALYASQATGAIEYLRLLEETRRREVDLSVVVDTSHLLISTLNVDDLLQQIAVRMAWVTGMSACAIVSLHRRPDSVHLLAQYTSLGERMDQGWERDFTLEDYPLARQVTQSNEPIWVQTDDAQADQQQVAALLQQGFKTMLLLPLWAADHPVGLVKLYSPRLDLQFSEERLRPLRALAEQVALALVNADLYQSEHENRTLAEVLSEISLALSSNLDQQAILDELLKQIERVVAYDSACVMLVEGGEARTAAHRGYDRFGVAGLMRNFHLIIDDVPNLKYMAETWKAKVIPDVKNDPEWVKQEVSAHIGSWVGVPLVAREHLLGLLMLDKVEVGYYKEDYVKRLDVVGRHAALALLNAQSFGAVEQASITDYVTNTYNRRYFRQQLQMEWDRANKQEHPLSLLIIDLDHFKKVNDAHGHLCGDQVLNTIAARMKEFCRASDMLARYGGEEFAVILPRTGGTGGMQVAERLRNAIAGLIIEFGEAQVKVTASLGVASYPENAHSVEELIDYADKALYQAKDQGRNRSVLYEDAEPG